MKRYFGTTGLVIFLMFTCLGFIGLNFNFFQTKAQKTAIEKWQYGAITNIYYFEPEREKINKIIAIVDFCQMNSKGCERIEIKHELDYARFLTAAEIPETFQARNRASLKASEIAFQKALAQLGNNGWELVSEPSLDFKPISLFKYEKLDDKSFLFTSQKTDAIYFKRLISDTYNNGKN